MSDNVTLTFSDISRRLHDLTMPEVDLIVGIASGGIVPAALLAHQLRKPMVTLQINYRQPDNSPRYNSPRLLSPTPTLVPGQRLLLVDDVAVSGQTLRLAQAQLSAQHVTTLVLKGQADFVLFPEVAACVNWPWRPAMDLADVISTSIESDAQRT